MRIVIPFILAAVAAAPSHAQPPGPGLKTGQLEVKAYQAIPKTKTAVQLTSDTSLARKLRGDCGSNVPVFDFDTSSPDTLVIHLKADSPEQLLGLAARLLPSEGLMGTARSRQLVPDGEAWIETGHRVLEDHRNLVAADATQRLLRLATQP